MKSGKINIISTRPIYLLDRRSGGDHITLCECKANGVAFFLIADGQKVYRDRLAPTSLVLETNIRDYKMQAIPSRHSDTDRVSSDHLQRTSRFIRGSECITMLKCIVCALSLAPPLITVQYRGQVDLITEMEPCPSSFHVYIASPAQRLWSGFHGTLS